MSAIPPAAGAQDAPQVPMVAAGDPARFLNRDVEWIEFNARVLDVAADPRTPLLERLRFLAIYGANLDEFFMKRLDVLKRQIEAGSPGPVPDALTPAQQLDAVRTRSRRIDTWRTASACFGGRTSGPMREARPSRGSARASSRSSPRSRSTRATGSRSSRT